MLVKPNNLKAISAEPIALGVMRTVHSQTPPVQNKLMSSERFLWRSRMIIGILKSGMINAAAVPKVSIIF